MGSSIDLVKKRVKKNITTAHIISMLMVVFTAFYIIKYNEKVVYVNGATFGVAGVAYAIRYIPLIILTGLCGNVPGMLCVLLVFAHRTVVYSAFSYMTFIYLLVVCVVDVLARKRWFGKWYKTLCVSAFLQLLVGNFWGAVLVLLSDQGISGLKWSQQPYFFLNEILGCLVGSFAVYFIL